MKLERLQERELRAVFKDNNSTYEQLLEKADLPTLLNSRLQDLCILMYKVKHKLCPTYISNIFKEPNSNYNLRQADFSIPRYETVTYGKHSIRYLGPKLWTKLPKNIRDVTTLTSFKSKIRQLNISELLDDGCTQAAASVHLDFCIFIYLFIYFILFLFYFYLFLFFF